MRVLHVTPYFAPAFRYGGPPRTILGLCRGLQESGVDVEVLTTTANGNGDLSEAAASSRLHEGIPVRYLRRGFPRRFFGASGLADALATAMGRVDIVHIHGLWNVPAWSAARAAGGARIPYVISPRGMLDPGSLAHHARRKRLAYWAVERRNLCRAALLHATSETEAIALRRHARGPEIVTLPNGVDPPPKESSPGGSFRTALEMGPADPLIVYLGRIHPTKRLDLLLAAFRGLRTQRARARLVIAGADELGHRAELERRFGGERAAVHWSGELSEPAKWALLAEASALVQCSDSESFGLSVAEALSAGVPVVVTRTCPWEEVERAGCGLWVDQRPEAITRALLRIAEDPDGSRAMGERGKALVRAEFSWSSIARAMSARYAKVLETSANGNVAGG